MYAIEREVDARSRRRDAETHLTLSMCRGLALATLLALALADTRPAIAAARRRETPVQKRLRLERAALKRIRDSSSAVKQAARLLSVDGGAPKFAPREGHELSRLRFRFVHCAEFVRHGAPCAFRDASAGAENLSLGAGWVSQLF